MLHRLILLVRHLRSVVFFKKSIRFLLVFLMFSGAWVATRKLDIPSTYQLSDKLVHVIVFLGFAVLIDLSSSRKPFLLWKGLPLLIYGMCIEIMQYFTPERSFSMFDWGADLAGILLYLITKKFILWLDSKKDDHLL